MGVERAPERIGRYDVVGRVGQGAMGAVYEARDSVLQRRVAVKVLRWHEARDDRGLRRLLREARAIAALSHPNVVEVYEVGEHDGGVFVAMEFIEGETLAQWEAARGRTWREILEVYLQAAAGLASAHARGIVHRDFKPQNVMIGGDTLARVVDFGLAIGVDESASDSPQSGSRVDSGSFDDLTRAGSVLGTPAFMAPEQHDGRRVGPAADQYAFCVSLYGALYGRRPYRGENYDGLVLAKKREAMGPRVTRRGPSALLRVLVRGLRASPDDRWPSMDALVGALRRTTSATRRPIPLVAGVTLALVAVPTVLLARAPGVAPCPGRDAAAADVLPAETRAAIATTLSERSDPGLDEVESDLDAYVERLATARVDACERRHEEGPSLALDRITLCLDRRGQEFAAAAEVLRSIEPDEAARIDAVIERLGAPEECDEDTSSAAARVPDDPEFAQRVARVRTMIATARSFQTAGLPGRGVPIAAEAVAAARELDYPPVLADALLRQGDLADRNYDAPLARAALEEAVWTAAAADYAAVEVHAAVILVYVTGFAGADADAARRWARYAEAKIDRLPEPGKVRTRLWNNMGLVEQRAGNPSAAVDLHRRCAQTREQLFGPDSYEVAASLSNLASALQEQGRPSESLPIRERSLELTAAHRGSRHLAVAHQLSNLGNVQTDLARYEAAVDSHEQAVEIMTEALGADHPALQRALSNLGVALTKVERFAEARRRLEGANALAARDQGNQHLLAGTLTNFGLMLLRTGDYPEARAVFQRVVEIRAEVHGVEHPQYANALTNLAIAQGHTGSHDLALDLFEQADPIASTDGAKTRNRVGWARSLVATGDATAGLEAATNALAYYGDHPATVDARVAAHLIAATAHLELDQKPAALEAATAAVEAARTGTSRSTIARAELHLANLASEPHRAQKAIEALQSLGLDPTRFPEY